MPISDDELEHGYGTHSHAAHMHNANMSKAEQRRSNKPIMEKRRRARINHCLNELKSLILDAMKKDPARHSKLEKADILEMTVKHLQSIQRQQLSLAVNTDPSVVHKFQTGFSECAGEVSRYVARLDNVETGVRQRLVSHLASCVSGLQQMTPLGTNTTTSSQSQPQGSPEDVNNNTASARLQMMSGLQLIPSRLPSGELALLLPNSQHLPFFPAPLENQVSTTTESPVTGSSMDRSRNSAFTAVSRDKHIRSPLPSPTSTTASSYGEESCDQPYPSPTHPPEVTSTSENHKSMVERSFTAYQNQKNEPQGLLQISPSNINNISSDFQNQPFPRFSPLSIKTLQTPLSVITSNDMLKEQPQNFGNIRVQPPINIKDPLDFSLKKEPFPNTCVSSLKRPYQEEAHGKPSEYQPNNKMSKLLTGFQNENSQVPERRSLFEIQNQVHSLVENHPPSVVTLEGARTFTSQNQLSTSSAEGARDMWRPW